MGVPRWPTRGWGRTIIKTYYGQGNQVTDIGHVVTMRLIRIVSQTRFDTTMKSLASYCSLG